MEVDSDLLGVYRKISTLDPSGGGVVFRGVDTRDGSAVALKTARSSRWPDVEALRREVRVLQHLKKAKVAGVLDILGSGQVHGVPWFASGWIEGTDFRSFLAGVEQPRGRERVPPVVEIAELEAVFGNPMEAVPTPEQAARVVRLLADLASVLGEVHAEGLFHGDLSPANLIISGGAPVLIDFGSAPAIFEAGVAREYSVGWTPGRGTLGYAAPEVLLGEALDHRCDIYSLGCIAYELFTGERAIAGRTTEELVSRHLHADVASLAREHRGIPRTLRQVLARMLEKDRSRRLSYVGEALAAFRAFLGDGHEVGRARSRPSVFRSALLERTAELEAIQRFIGSASAESSHCMVLEGQLGAGKTRLLSEAALIAARQGMRVVVCRGAHSAEVSPDHSSGSGSGALELLQPLFAHALDVMRSYDESSPDSPPGKAAFRRLAPIIEPYVPELVPAEGEAVPVLSPSGSLQRLFGALLELLQQLAGANGLLLVLDDLQWADALSADFLREHAGQFAARRVLVCGALRTDGDLRDAPPVFGAAPTTRIVVQRLSDAGVVELVKSMLATEQLPDGLADHVVSQCDGNPFFAAEHVRLALEREWLWFDAPRWFFRLPTDRELPAPRSVDELVAARLRAVPPAARSVLECAAIFGQHFELSELADFVAAPDVAVLGALQLLLDTGVLAMRSSTVYAFTHESIRLAVIRSLEPTVRLDLHRRRALGLERQERSAPERLHAALGHHWSHAGDPLRATEHFEAAARRAVAEHALALASRFYRSAIQQCQMSRAPDRQQRLSRLHECAADVLVTRAMHLEAREAYREALNGAMDALPRARLHRKIAISHWTLHEYEAARETLGRAEEELGEPNDETPREHWQELIEIRLNVYEHLYFAQTKGPQISELLRALEPTVEAHGTDYQKCTFYLAAAGDRQLAARYAFDPQAVALALRAYRVCDGLALEERANTRFLYAFTLVFGSQEHREQALPLLEDAARDAEQLQAVTLLSRIRAYQAIAIRRLNRVEAASMAAHAALHTARAAGLPPYVAAALACKGWADWRSGRISEARADLSRALEIWSSHPHPFPLRWLATVPLLAFCNAEDDFESASRLLTDLVDAGQQALPDQLVRLVRLAIASCSADSPRECCRAIDKVLAEARAQHFC